MKVFLSSTCYDLLDVRAEVVSHLSENGIRVMASDDKLSDFHVTTDQNSIETCLANVRSCDHFVIILDQRYGPILSDFGHNVSATHLEYQEATKEGKQIHLFARDRLVADYSIWKKNGEQSMRFAWVKNEKDHSLFRLLKEHEIKRDSVSNWIETFSSSIDLKSALFKRFRNIVTPGKLAIMIAKNDFPILDIVAESPVVVGVNALLRRTLYNRGDSPAFNLRITNTEHENPGKNQNEPFFLKRPLTRHCSLPLNCKYKLPAGFNMLADRNHDQETLIQLEYDSIHGIHVSDVFLTTVGFRSGSLAVNSQLQERTYSYCEPLRIEISESAT